MLREVHAGPITLSAPVPLQKMRGAALIALGLLCAPCAADGLYSRDLSCREQTSQRSKEICMALEGALEWRWTGHAIISPGFRIGSEGLKQVYCSLPILPADAPELLDMAARAEGSGGRHEVQLHDGVVSLLSMLGEEGLERFPPPEQIADGRTRATVRYLQEHVRLAISESSTSIFSPSHPAYVLRDGCN